MIDTYSIEPSCILDSGEHEKFLGLMFVFFIQHCDNIKEYLEENNISLDTFRYFYDLLAKSEVTL